MDIETVDLDARRYAFLRHRGAYPKIGETFGRLSGIAGPSGLVACPGALFIGVYHDDPNATPIEELRSDAGITVDDAAPIPQGLEEGTLPAGRYARGVHVGPYDRMAESWEAFWDAVVASGAAPRHVSPFEIYVSDMATTASEALVTELYMAVE